VVDESLNGFGVARARTLRTVAPLSQTQLDFSPRERRWSIGEVLDHLLLAEGLYRGEIARLVALKRAGRRAYLRRSFADINGAPFFLPDIVLSWLEAPFAIVSRFIPEPLRALATEYPIVPIRNPDAATPRSRRPGPTLRAELLSSLEHTRVLIVSNAHLDFSQMISEHPLTGVSDVAHMLTFLALHERRHHRQIDRVRSDSRFPPA
jgi:hypothetical protein